MNPWSLIDADSQTVKPDQYQLSENRLYSGSRALHDKFFKKEFGQLSLA